jgi:hypothetical protein
MPLTWFHEEGKSFVMIFPTVYYFTCFFSFTFSQFLVTDNLVKEKKSYSTAIRCLCYFKGLQLGKKIYWGSEKRILLFFCSIFQDFPLAFAQRRETGKFNLLIATLAKIICLQISIFSQLFFCGFRFMFFIQSWVEKAVSTSSSP